jgi:hypothetical protein
MRRFILVALAVLAAVGALAGTAAGRGDDWTPVTATPFDWQCGATTVHVTFPVNKEYQRVTTLADGTLLLQVTGSLKVNLATDAGASLTVNASGPTNKATFDPATGNLDFISTGQNLIFLTASQAAATGLPQLFTTSGPIDILFRSDGTVQVNQINTPTLTDLCAALRAS